MWPSPFLCQYPYTWHSISFIFASLLLLEWSFFRTKQPLIIVAWRAVSLKPVSLKSSSLNRGHHPSLQVPLALRWKKVGPKSGLETSNANDTHSLALLTQLKLLAELHADLFSRHASTLEVCICFRGGRRYRWRRFVRRDLSSMKTAEKEAWRPKCTAPKLVCEYALFLETFMHVYVPRTTHDQMHSAKTPPGGQVSGWTCRTFEQKFRVHIFKTAWAFGLLCGKHAYFT